MYRCIWGMKVFDKGCKPHKETGGHELQVSPMHQSHTLQGSCIKLKTREDCALSPFMYGCIWGMKVLDNLINISLFIPLCLLSIG